VPTGFTVASDWKVVDGTEAVTYFSKTADGTFAAGVTIPNALRRNPSREQITAAGLLGKTAVNFNVWQSQIGATVPKVNDRITDAAGFKWDVRRVEFQTFLSRYRLTCQREL
jgi:hypothetical protein